MEQEINGILKFLIDDDLISLGVVVLSGVVISVNVKVLTRTNIIDLILLALIIFGVGLSILEYFYCLNLEFIV